MLRVVDLIFQSGHTAGQPTKIPQWRDVACLFACRRRPNTLAGHAYLSGASLISLILFGQEVATGLDRDGEEG